MSDPDLPRHDELADDDDLLGWNTTEHGRMVEYADDTPLPTVPLTIDAVPEA